VKAVQSTLLNSSFCDWGFWVLTSLSIAGADNKSSH